MSFGNVDRFVGIRDTLLRRRSARAHPVPDSIRGGHGVGRWWYLASGRQRTSLLAVAVAGTAVASVVVSQLVAPFWWTSAGPSHLAGGRASQAPTATPAVMDQQTLWGLITGQPGAAPATLPPSSGLVTVGATVATTPAPAGNPVAMATFRTLAIVRAAFVPATAPAPAVVPATAPAAAAVAMAASPAARVDAQMRRNLVNSGAARLLCANDPVQVERLGLASYCATIPALGATAANAPSVAHRTSLAHGTSGLAASSPTAGHVATPAGSGGGGAAGALAHARALGRSAPPAPAAHDLPGSP